MPVALFRQEADHLGGSGPVVGGKGGKVPKAQPLGGVGEKDAGDGNGPKALAEPVQIPSQEKNARRLALPAEAQSIAHLVAILIQVVDAGVLVIFSQQGLEALHQTGKEHILGALHQDKNAVPRLLL